MATHRQLAEEALEAGRNKFIPEKPCVNGHKALRFTSPPYACTECHTINTRNSRHGTTKKRTYRKAPLAPNAIEIFEAEVQAAMACCLT